MAWWDDGMCVCMFLKRQRKNECPGKERKEFATENWIFHQKPTNEMTKNNGKIAGLATWHTKCVAEARSHQIHTTHRPYYTRTIHTVAANDEEVELVMYTRAGLFTCSPNCNPLARESHGSGTNVWNAEKKWLKMNGQHTQQKTVVLLLFESKNIKWYSIQSFLTIFVHSFVPFHSDRMNEDGDLIVSKKRTEKKTAKRIWSHSHSFLFYSWEWSVCFYYSSENRTCKHHANRKSVVSAMTLTMPINGKEAENGQSHR